jgi:hypothetical protein
VSDCGSLEFAQARLQSRHGESATEATWQRLEVARELSALLDAARHSPLQRWLPGITLHSSGHEIEGLLRRQWRATVAEVAGWMPAPWQPSLHWCALLPDLPVLQHLLQGGEPAAWMADEPAWRALCSSPAAERAAALVGGPLAALAVAGPGPLLPAWQAEWQRRLPHPLGGPDDPLRQLTRALQAHAAACAAAPPGPGNLLRTALRSRLLQLWRRATLTPAAAFVHLGLCALDLERLRGELLTRRLFPPQPATAAEG